MGIGAFPAIEDRIFPLTVNLSSIYTIQPYLELWVRFKTCPGGIHFEKKIKKIKKNSCVFIITVGQ
jgi:hypothetical protein